MMQGSYAMSRFVNLVFAAAIALAVLSLLGMRPSSAVTDGILIVCVLVLTQKLGTVCHEAGHLIAGLARGLSLARFSVGLLSIDRAGGVVRVRIQRRSGQDAGHVCMTGWKPGQRGITDHLVMVLGGPTAHLLFGLSLIVASRGLDGWLAIGVEAGGWWNGLMALTNLVPFSTAHALSDGAVVRLILTRRDKAEELLLAGRWMELYLGPDAPGSWPDEIVQGMEATFASAHQLNGADLERARFAGSMLYLHYVDRGEWSEATHVITRTADLPGPAKLHGHDRPADLTDTLHAIHLGRRGRNPLAARSALRRVHPKSSLARNSLYFGAQATIALLEGEPLAARGLATEAKKQLRKSVRTVGVDRLEDSWWDEVIAAAAPGAFKPPVAVPPRPKMSAPVTTPVALAVMARDEQFAWDPGVPSDLRTVWMRRGQQVELSA